MLHEEYAVKYNLPARSPRPRECWIGRERGLEKYLTTREMVDIYDRKWQKVRLPNMNDEVDILLEQVNYNELCKDVDFGINKDYSMDQKVSVVATFITTGNLLKSAELNAVPYNVVRQWKYQDKWWTDAESEIRKAKSRLFDQMASKIIIRCLNEIEDRLENGDEVFDSKSQEIKKLKPNIKALGDVMSRVFDKRQMVLGMPTSRTEHVKSEDLLKDLKKQFQDIADGKVIDGIVVKEVQ